MANSLQERTVDDVLKLVANAAQLPARAQRIAVAILTAESEKGHAQLLVKNVNWNYVDNRLLNGLADSLELGDTQNSAAAQ